MPHRISKGHNSETILNKAVSIVLTDCSILKSLKLEKKTKTIKTLKSNLHNPYKAKEAPRREKQLVQRWHNLSERPPHGRRKRETIYATFIDINQGTALKWDSSTQS